MMTCWGGVSQEPAGRARPLRLRCSGRGYTVSAAAARTRFARDVVGVALSGVEICRIVAVRHSTVLRQQAGPARLITTARSTFAPAEGAERRSPHGLRLRNSPSRKEKARAAARVASAPDGNCVGLMLQPLQPSFPRPKGDKRNSAASSGCSRMVTIERLCELCGVGPDGPSVSTRVGGARSQTRSAGVDVSCCSAGPHVCLALRPRWAVSGAAEKRKTKMRW